MQPCSQGGLPRPPNHHAPTISTPWCNASLALMRTVCTAGRLRQGPCTACRALNKKVSAPRMMATLVLTYRSIQLIQTQPLHTLTSTLPLHHSLHHSYITGYSTSTSPSQYDLLHSYITVCSMTTHHRTMHSQPVG